MQCQLRLKQYLEKGVYHIQWTVYTCSHHCSTTFQSIGIIGQPMSKYDSKTLKPFAVTDEESDSDDDNDDILSVLG